MGSYKIVPCLKERVATRTSIESEKGKVDKRPLLYLEAFGYHI